MNAGDSIHADFVVVGCGIAGLRAAIGLGEAGRVLVLAKAKLTETATQVAQGGIAAALSDEDEIGLHEQDTLKAGDGLCDAEAVRVLVEEGPKYIQELIEWGTQFDRAGTKLAFTREGAHSRSRVLHAHGDSTGMEISRALFAKAKTLPEIEIRAHAFTTELIVDGGRVAGLRFLDEKEKQLQEVRAGAVLLASGGAGQVYRETTNPAVATGDGLAIAYRAGAVLSDLEFVQFHPTALATKGAPRFLLSEALRGEGGVLRNMNLDRFMQHYHESAELAPRDVVARAMLMEMQKTGADFVYLDMTDKDASYVKKRFPRIYETCLGHGLDITDDLIPVRPAAHYMMGGVQTDLYGRTSLPGLYAAGETASTGVHGANRLASNSLLEGLVFGARAGVAMAAEVKPTGRAAAKAASAAKHANSGQENPGDEKPAQSGESPRPEAGANAAVVEKIRNVMWKKVGILRDGKELAAAVEKLEKLASEVNGKADATDRAAHEAANLRVVAELIAKSALAREESRGSHYRGDFPFRNDEDYQKHSVVATGKRVAFR